MIRLLVVSLKLSLQLARWSCMLSPQPVKVATCTSTVCNIKSDRVFKKLIIFWANVIPWSWLFLRNPIFFFGFQLSIISYWCLMWNVQFWFLRSMGVKGKDGVEYRCLHMCNSEHDRYDVCLWCHLMLTQRFVFLF